MRIRSLIAAGAVPALACAGVLPGLTGIGAAAQTPTRALPAAGPVPAGFQPDSVTFVSASDGWVLGTAPCAHKPCTSVLSTTNGGRTWQGIPAPRYPLARFAGQKGLDRLRFASTATGYAYGSQLWVTHNGGAGWHRVAFPGYVADLETAGGVAYAASVTPHEAVTIYRSTIGTDSWSRVSGLPAGVTGFGGLGTITLHGTAGWVNLGSHVYATTTGESWTRLGFRCPHDYGIASIGAFSSDRVTLLCAGQPAVGSTQKLLYYSVDGGTHFVKVGSPPSGGDGGVLAQPGSAHVFIATASGATWLYVSTDGGRHWRNSLLLDDGGKGWADFGFTTASQGVAVEGVPALGSHMYMTYNSGRSWHRVTF
ncbi:MAG TPA: hypothetical protein VLX31_14805 [Streptosporangiaceae bacterium]|nr:hypothetical protein [Streptosporangiaceae bacterium]